MLFDPHQSRNEPLKTHLPYKAWCFVLNLRHVGSWGYGGGGGGCKVRADLECCKNIFGQLRIVAQDKVLQGNGWYGGQDGNLFYIEKNLKLEFSKGLRLPKKLNLQRLPLAASVAMLVAMSIFHPCLKLSTKYVLVIVYTPADVGPIS
jgi:hypothetical protein